MCLVKQRWPQSKEAAVQHPDSSIQIHWVSLLWRSKSAGPKTVKQKCSVSCCRTDSSRLKHIHKYQTESYGYLRSSAIVFSKRVESKQSLGRISMFWNYTTSKRMKHATADHVIMSWCKPLPLGQVYVVRHLIWRVTFWTSAWAATSPSSGWGCTNLTKILSSSKKRAASQHSCLKTNTSHIRRHADHACISTKHTCDSYLKTKKN